MHVNKAEIIAENNKRRAKFEVDYDPHTGKNSVLDREEVTFSDVSEKLYLPREMMNDPATETFLEIGNLHDYADTFKMTFEQALGIFTRHRFKFDFEYWSIVTLMIVDKETADTIPFKLRLAQQILLLELEKMRLAGVPIRLVLLKARQWGGSTLVQMYMFWIQQIHKKNWNLAVCAQDDGAANNISELYRRASVTYPRELATVTYRPYARSPKNIVNVERGGIIGVGSINNPDQFRSFNYPMIHISEPGIWQDTPKRTAKQLVTSLRSNVPQKPLTMVILESTAKGVGTFFHDEWLKAQRKISGYKGLFVPWFMIPMYTKEIDNYPEFIDSMDDYAWFCWEQGATLEGIAWYRHFKKTENYDDWMMYNEYPTTAEEAFVASGQRYFEPKIVIPIKETIIAPKMRASIFPTRVSSKKELKETLFKQQPNGRLKIWGMPTTEVMIKDRKYRVVNRYCAAADIGGTTPTADFSSITVLDRYWMLFGGGPQLAADWHGHLHQDLFAWVAAQVAFAYDNALLAIETNSLKREKKDGDHYLTILDTIKDHYDNLYIRNKLDSTEKDWEPKYGFHTNSSSKDMILSSLRSGLRDRTYTEKDFGAYEEFGFFERKDDGTLGAIDGQHDDRVITRAMAHWLATSPIAMDPVKLVEVLPEGKRNKRSQSAMGII